MRKRIAAALAICASSLAALFVAVPQASAASAVNPDEINKSIVWVITSWQAEVVVPFQDGSSKRYNATTSKFCTGWFVDTDGRVATAGHCVEPDNAVKYGLYRDVIETNKFGNIKAEDYNWDYTITKTTAQIGQPNGIEGAPLSDKDLLTVQIIDFQPFVDGDNALLWASTLSGTPALSVATERPAVLDEVTAIGFPAVVGEVTDAIRQPPSYKVGRVSSVSTTDNGVPISQIDAAVSGGMSGGPTINATGQVVGINSFRLTRETQQFNFITDTETMRVFLESNGVSFETPATPDAGQVPVPAAPSSSSGSFPWMTLVIVVLALAIIALLVVVVLQNRRNRPAATMVAAPATSEAAVPDPPAAGEQPTPSE